MRSGGEQTDPGRPKDLPGERPVNGDIRSAQAELGRGTAESTQPNFIKKGADALFSREEGISVGNMRIFATLYESSQKYLGSAHSITSRLVSIFTKWG